MNLPGIIAIAPDEAGLIERVGAFMGESFLEEPWTAELLNSLDIDEKRRCEIARILLTSEFELAAHYGCAYVLEDESAAALGFLGSELLRHETTWTEIEDEASESIASEFTEGEAAAIAAQERRMAPISYFGWGSKEADDLGYSDYIYFAAWAVDVHKRGSGAFRRLATPFFDFADEHGIPCFLECYSDDLESLYAHVGFEAFRVLEAPGFDIRQTCMVRHPDITALQRSALAG